jgi:hypothetical protein
MSKVRSLNELAAFAKVFPSLTGPAVLQPQSARSIDKYRVAHRPGGDIPFHVPAGPEHVGARQSESAPGDAGDRYCKPIASCI